jgi:amino acid permease
MTAYCISTKEFTPSIQNLLDTLNPDTMLGEFFFIFEFHGNTFQIINSKRESEQLYNT